jgi:FdhD protein
MYRPILTAASRPLTYTVAAVNERGETEPTQIAGEHPLTLYVDKREIVTLMTLGAAPECLAIGYLRNQKTGREHRGHRRGASRPNRRGGRQHEKQHR